MVRVESRACDVDGRTVDVSTVTVVSGRRAVEVDLCARCLKSVSIQTAMEKGHRPQPATPKQKRFTKTDIVLDE